MGLSLLRPGDPPVQFKTQNMEILGEQPCCNVFLRERLMRVVEQRERRAKREGERERERQSEHKTSKKWPCASRVNCFAAVVVARGLSQSQAGLTPRPN